MSKKYLEYEGLQNIVSKIRTRLKQYETMPVASVHYLDRIVQYIGATTSNYINGQFYKCQEVSGSSPTAYEWILISGNALNTLDDVELTNLSDKQILTWDNTNSKWVNEDNNALKQYSTMPTPTKYGEYVQYVGNNTADYVKGHMYVCTYGTDGTTLVWKDYYSRGKNTVLSFSTLDELKTYVSKNTVYNNTVILIRNVGTYFVVTSRASGDTEDNCIFISDTQKIVVDSYINDGKLPIIAFGGVSGTNSLENSRALTKAITEANRLGMIVTVPWGNYIIKEPITITRTFFIEGTTPVQSTVLADIVTSKITFDPEVGNTTLFTDSGSHNVKISHIKFACSYTTMTSVPWIESQEIPHEYITWNYTYENVNCLDLASSNLSIEDVDIVGFSGFGLKCRKALSVDSVRISKGKYGFYNCGGDCQYHASFIQGCEYGFYWNNGGAVLFSYDTWIDQCGYGLYTTGELSGLYNGEIDHCLYAGIYANSCYTGLKVDARFGRLGMYYAGEDMLEKAKLVTTFTQEAFDDMSKGVDIAIRNGSYLDINVSELPKVIGDSGSGTKRLPTLFLFGENIQGIIKTAYDFGNRAYYTINKSCISTFNEKELSKIDALPTPTAYNEGKLFILNSPQTGYIEGGIYKCEEVTPSTDSKTYHWKLINGNGITYTAGNGIKIEGDVISTDIPNFDESAIQILIRKGKNVLLSASSNKGNTIQGQYGCMITNIFPSTDYKIYLKPNVSFSITSWVDNISGYTGSISTEGQWIDFSTNSSFVHAVNNPYRELFKFSTSVSPVFENICAVKLEDWYEGMLPIDNSGYLYTLPYSLKQNEHIVEKLVNRDDAWYKDTICDNVITNSIKLDERSNSILTLASHIANNSSLGYTVSLIDSNGEILIENMDLAVSDMENLTISDYRFLHKGKEFQINAINESNYGLLDYDDTEDYTNAIISPFVFFDAVNLGNNTIQLNIENALFYKNHVARPSSDYQIVFDVADLISSMGIRLVFKFYTFNWNSDDTNNETLIVEKMFVDRYKNHKNVIGYSVANEPGNNYYTPTSTTEKARYLAFMKEIHKYITDNSNQLMFYETDVEGFEHDGNNLVHESHFYSPMSFSHGNQALQQYPYDKFVCKGSNQVGGDTYHEDEPSSYPQHIYFSNSSGTIGWTDICVGRIINDNQYQKEKLYNHGLKFQQINNGIEYCDLKQTVFNYYDNNDTLVRSLVFDIEENEDINKYQIIWQKGTTTYPTPSNYLSIVQEDDEYVLRVQMSSDDIGALLQLKNVGLANASANEYIDSWHSAFNPNEAYVEVVATVRIHSDELTRFSVEATATKNYWNYCIAGTPNYMSLILNARRNDFIKYNEPLYIGEVGVRTNTYPSTSSRQQHPEQYEKGGTQWTKDFMKIAHEMKLSLAWFIHTGSAFGIYETKVLRNMQGYYWGKPVYNAIKDANTNHIIYDEYKLETEIIPNGFNAPTTIAVYDALELKADKTDLDSFVDEISALPTPNASREGLIYLLTATQTGYQKGGIYQCVSDGAASPTYSWELISATDIIPITQAELEAMW